MASKKELLQAQTWMRRRLLTAFTSGAPGGRELEPAAPTRGLVTGLVLAALVLGGSYAAGLFDRGLPDGWDDGRIVLVQDNAARYVTADGDLVPVPNMATARLLVPPGSEIITVSADLVADVHRRGAVGIVGAPDSLPALTAMVPDGWLACVAADGGTLTQVLAGEMPDGAGSPGATTGPAGSGSAPDGPSALVSVAAVADGDRSLYLVQDGVRYAVPDTAESVGVLRALGYTPEDAVPVEARWLALFGEGQELVPFTLPQAGEPVPGALANLPGATVGSVLEVGQGAYLVLADGELARLSPFADALYATGSGGLLGRIAVTPAQVASVPEVPVEESPLPRTWPVRLAVPVADGSVPCARLDVGGFTSWLEAGAPRPTGGVEVTPGAGAVALFTSSTDSASGPVRYVDENGVAYPVVDSPAGDVAAALTRLFGEGAGAVPVPYAWGDLFPSGPTLSISAAGTAIAPEGS